MPSAYLADGGSLIFQYMRRLGPLAGVLNCEFQYFGSKIQKKMGGGMKILWIFIWRSSRNWAGFLIVISMHLRVFS